MNLGLGLSLGNRLLSLGGGSRIDPSDFDGGTITLYTGSVETDAGDALATGTLPSRAFNDESGGERELHGLWSMIATKNGTARGLFLQNAGGSIKTWFTVTQSGGGGDIIIDQNTIQINDVISITTMTWVLEGASLNVTGSVVNGSAVAVPGGTIQLINGSGTVVDTDTPDVNGAFTVSALIAGIHTVKYHPPLAYCLGPSEADYHTVNVNGGQSPVAIVAQSAVWSDNLQSYTTDIQYTRAVLQAGDFFKSVPNGASGARNNTADVHYDATGGIGGLKGLRYDWPAQPSNTADYYVGLEPMMNPLPQTYTELWWRVTCKEQASFEHGSSSPPAARAYKFLLLAFDHGADNGRFGVYFQDALLGVELSTAVLMDIICRVGGATVGNATNDGSQPLIGNPWGGAFHTWVFGITGLGSSSCTFKLYMDGTLLGSISAPFFPSSAVGAGFAATFGFGSNINNGPQHAQSRWFGDSGIYTRRPSLIVAA